MMCKKILFITDKKLFHFDNGKFKILYLGGDEDITTKEFTLLKFNTIDDKISFVTYDDILELKEI